MTTVRKPAVAGRFYPDDARVLQSTIKGYLDAAEPGTTAPKAIIVPHAGYVYSGPVAGSGYAQLELVRKSIRRIVLLGPSHFVSVRGLAACRADVFDTPLGSVSIDTEALACVLALPQVEILEAAHAREHSLEVHLPFLQEILDDFQVLPLLVGNPTLDEVGEIIELLWNGPETLFVISSDLSHFHDYETATRLDRETSRLIGEMRFEELRGDRACGYKPISGLLRAARSRSLHVRIIDVRNSGDMAGARDRVVGYGAYVVE